MKKIISAVGIYIAAVVGAGFASGQEAVSYFVRYGRISLIGVAIASFLFGAFAYSISDGIRKLDLDGFDEYIASYVNKNIAAVLSAAVKIFMASVFFAMISGGTELLYQSFCVPSAYGSAIICAICAFVMMSGSTRLLKLNSLLGIFLCAAILFVCFYILRYRETQAVFLPRSHWIISAVSYTGYNILTAGAAVSSIRLDSKKECILFGIWSCVSIFAMMFCIWLVLSIYAGKIYLGELPMLTLAMRSGKGITIFFSAVLFTAMLTTALSAGLSLLPRQKNILDPLILCAGGYLASHISFSFIVGIVYRICGYAGNIFLMIILIKQLKYDFLRKTKKIQDTQS